MRSGYGVLGAICINIDINYVRDEVLRSVENTAAFLARYSQTDERLALTGKRHFRGTVAAGRGAE